MTQPFVSVFREKKKQFSKAGLYRHLAKIYSIFGCSWPDVFSTMTTENALFSEGDCAEWIWEWDAFIMNSNGNTIIQVGSQDNVGFRMEIEYLAQLLFWLFAIFNRVCKYAWNFAYRIGNDKGVFFTFICLSVYQ